MSKPEFQVYDKCCKNCLFTSGKIVSDNGRDELVEDCVNNNTHFICHKSSVNGGQVCCRTFYDKFKDRIQKLQIFERLGLVKFVPHTNNEKLIAYNELEESTKESVSNVSVRSGA